MPWCLNEEYSTLWRHWLCHNADIDRVLFLLLYIGISIRFYHALGQDKLYWPGVIMCMHPASERRRYIVKLFLIGWPRNQNDPWFGNFDDVRILRKWWLPLVGYFPDSKDTRITSIKYWSGAKVSDIQINVWVSVSNDCCHEWDYSLIILSRANWRE